MIWILMFATGLFTFGTRFFMLSGAINRDLPNWLKEALHFVPIAVLTAIIAPAVLINPITNEVTITGNSRLFAAIISILVAIITRQVIYTIAAGLATLWLLDWTF